MQALQLSEDRLVSPIAPVLNKPVKAHLPFLDGLRASAALFVVLYHVWLECWPAMFYPGHAELRPHGMAAKLTGWLGFGHTAVTVFIAISGYCLMLPILKGDGSLNVVKFLRRRAQRILPPYYAAFAISLLLSLTVLRPGTFTLSDITFPVNAVGVISHLLLLQNFTPNEYQISVPLWSVAVEVQIYLLFPMLLLLRRKGSMLLTLLASAVIGFGACRLLIGLGMGDRASHYLLVFALGMLAAELASKFQHRPALVRTATLATLPVLLILGFLAYRFSAPSYSKDLTDTVVGLTMCSLMTFVSVCPDSLFGRFLSCWPMTKIGVMSYSVYLLHFPLLQLLWQFAIVPSGMSRTYAFVVLTLVGIPLILLISRVFFHFVEKPFLYAKRSSPAERPSLGTVLSSDVASQAAAG